MTERCIQNTQTLHLAIPKTISNRANHLQMEGIYNVGKKNKQLLNRKTQRLYQQRHLEKLLVLENIRFNPKETPIPHKNNKVWEPSFT